MPAPAQPGSLVALADTPFESGRAHGQACGAEIRAFVGDRLARVNALRALPLEREAALAAALRQGRFLQDAAPALAEEVRGLAAGAGLSFAEALLLQYRRELVGWESREAHGCSLMAWAPPQGGPLLAQTIDLEGGVADLVRVFRTPPGLPGGAPRVLMVGLAGLVGYLGLNDRGLAIGINMVLSKGWRLGVSPYLLVRHLLGRASLDEAVGELRRLGRSSSRCLTLLQGRRCVTVEMTADDLRVSEGLPAAHTNHYLHRDFEPLDASNPFSKNSSRQRLALVGDRLRGPAAPAGAEQALDALADHSMFPVGVCMHAQGHLTRADTVAAVVMDPARGTLHLRRGHPCTAPTEVFTL